MSAFLHVEGKGPCAQIVFPNRRGVYIQSLIVSTCPKCQGYMQTIPVPRMVTEVAGTIGKWRCLNCGYIPELDIYDKQGMAEDRGGIIL